MKANCRHLYFLLSLLFASHFLLPGSCFSEPSKPVDYEIHITIDTNKTMTSEEADKFMEDFFEKNFPGSRPYTPVVDYAKELKMNIFDPGLPDESFEAWFTRIVGPEFKITWKSEICDEEGEPMPVCVTALATKGDCGQISVLIMTGNTSDSISGEPSIFRIYIAGLGPTIELYKRDIVKFEEKVGNAKERAESFASIPLNHIPEAEAIEYAKNIEISVLDNRLPNISLGKWLNDMAGPGWKVEWALSSGDGCYETYDNDRCFRVDPPKDCVRRYKTYRPYWQPDQWPRNDENDICSSEYKGKQTTRGFDCWAYVNVRLKNTLESFSFNIRVGTIRKGTFGQPIAGKVSYFTKDKDFRHFPVFDLSEMLLEAGK